MRSLNGIWIITLATNSSDQIAHGFHGLNRGLATIFKWLNILFGQHLGCGIFPLALGFSPFHAELLQRAIEPLTTTFNTHGSGSCLL